MCCFDYREKSQSFLDKNNKLDTVISNFIIIIIITDNDYYFHISLYEPLPRLKIQSSTVDFYFFILQNPAQLYFYPNCTSSNVKSTNEKVALKMYLQLS